MTANLVRWDPTGSDGADVAALGTPLSTVTKVGGGTVKYESDAGFERGSEVGVRTTSPTDTDQAYVFLPTTAAAAGSAQMYIEFEAWPAAVMGFFDIRSSTQNLIRAAVGTGGQLTCQNLSGAAPGGTLSGTLYTMALNTKYRIELDVDPGVSTNDGYGALRLWSDADVSLANPTPISNGSFGTTNPSVVRAGDSQTATSQGGMILRFSQLAIDTGGTVPTITAVTKNVTPPTASGNFPRILVSGVWQ